jgi:Cu(I)/Ag(I) efflux system membrane fusion protein
MLEKIKTIITKNKKIMWLFTVIFAFSLGWLFSGGGGTDAVSTLSGTVENHPTGIWTCSMHPQIRQPGPGKCPICGMDLIPVRSSRQSDAGSGQIILSDYAQRLAGIQVAPVERKIVSKEIRLVGKIDYDESRLKYITARVAGRIDRMYVDFTGIPVRSGDHLVELYSPDLVSTQQELIQTSLSLQKSDSQQLRLNLDAIQERLRLWGMTQAQIEQIQSSQSISDRMTIFAPISGVVIQKDGVEGAYVETGSRIYTVADLSSVWLKMDAYESDISWIRYGQHVRFETEAYPGSFFTGKIAFIDPVLNENTRTVKVRVNVKNDDGRLKPGMFVHAEVESKVAAGGKVVDSELSGKWICPMHPEVIKGGPAVCDVCGMPLVKAETLGYVSAGEVQKTASMVIPATAPLITGKRAIVYVRLPGDEGRFESREIILGPRAGDYYIVHEGLREGEWVVTRGNFKIDSAVQILAKPSMMNPQNAAFPVKQEHDGEHQHE